MHINKKISLFFLFVFVLPVAIYAQTVQHDSTLAGGVGTGAMPGRELKGYRDDIGRIYFSSFERGDSLLEDARVRYGIRVLARKKSLSANRLSRYGTDFVADSTGSTYYFPLSDQRAQNYFMYFRMPAEFVSIPVKKVGRKAEGGMPFLSLHGNFLYEYLYRSRIDTPFADKNFQQHSEQVYADAVIKGKYPFRVVLNSRQSNSPYFKNYTSVDLQFNHFAYLQGVKDALLREYTAEIKAASNLSRLEAVMAERWDSYNELKAWIESPARTQEIVEEKEAIYAQVVKLENQEKKVRDIIAGIEKKQVADSFKNILAEAAIEALKQRLAAEKDSLVSIKDSAGKTTKSAKLGGAIHKRVADKKNYITRLEDSIRLLTSKRDLRSMAKKMQPDSSIANKISGEKKGLAKKYDSAKTTLSGLSEKVDSLKSAPEKTRESLLAKILQSKDSMLAKMKLPGRTEKEVEAKKAELDSLHKNIGGIQRQSDSLRQTVQAELAEYSRLLQSARTAGDLKAIAAKAKNFRLGKFDQNILSVTKLGIGRTNINYSDLTINNISLTGLNIEYNPSFYAAFAVGSVDYMFRDFAIRADRLPKQNLLLARFGWGDRERRSFILTAYRGTRNRFGGQANGPQPTIPVTNVTQVFGYSMEIKYKVNQHMDVSFEGAKSSAPYTVASDRAKSMSNAFVFSDRNNEAWSAKLDFAYPKTKSVFNAFYRQTGANFQSYSIFNTGSRQESWGVKWRQYLWGRRLSVTGQVRKTGLDNPLVSRSYNSSVVFKSIQAVLRIKKWPVLSVGYMPNSQLTKSPDGSFIEDIYYTFTASSFYNYKVGKKYMNSGLLYTRFYNKGTDSGFARYNAKNLMLTHNMEVGKLRSLTDVQYTSQPLLTYYTVLQKVDMQVGRFLNAGVGIKNSWLPNGTTYWGGVAQAGIIVGKIGSFQFQYDKGYLPDSRSMLVPNDWGRASFTKIF